MSQKLFGQVNRLQVNNLPRGITGDETWVSFENPRSAMLVGAEVKHPVRPKQHIDAKNGVFSVCFTPIGIVDIIIFPG
jgi:hypothetical protein